VAQYDNEGYRQAQGDFLLPPRRTDALDDSFDDDGDDTPGFVVRPESELEIAARLAGEQSPTPGTDDLQTPFFDRRAGILGDAIGSAVKAVQPKPRPPDPLRGGVIYNPLLGNVIQAIGIHPVSVLEERQQRLAENYSDKASKAAVLVRVEIPTYHVMEAWIETAAARHEVLNFKEAERQIQERRRDLNYIRDWRWIGAGPGPFVRSSPRRRSARPSPRHSSSSGRWTSSSGGRSRGRTWGRPGSSPPICSRSGNSPVASGTAVGWMTPRRSS